MKKGFLFVSLWALSALVLAGCGEEKNQYKDKMKEWFDDSANQSEVLKNDNKCDVLLGLIDKDSKVISNELLDITDGEYLYDVLVRYSDKYTLQGSDSQYGYFLTGINNIVADYSADGSYISLWINGDYSQYGVSGLALHDNDVVACVYMIGY